MSRNSDQIIRGMADMAKAARQRWEAGTELAIAEIREFADSIGPTLGTISRDEAVDALKRFAGEAIERLR